MLRTVVIMGLNLKLKTGVKVDQCQTLVRKPNLACSVIINLIWRAKQYKITTRVGSAGILAGQSQQEVH